MSQFINRLKFNGLAIQNLALGLSEGQANWKPTPSEWSILEVINHLYDEEREDFRQRLDLCLHQPDQPWPPIDPAGWAEARGYNQRDLAQSLENFLAERQTSLAWLKELNQPNWHNVYKHPHLGPLQAGDVMASWLAHDCLHIRQLTHLHWQYSEVMASPYHGFYAGDW
ncbi:MAG: DinB family protein [Chloroflexota bacterium]